MKVTELMHTSAVTCRPEDTVGEAARLMSGRRVGSVETKRPRSTSGSDL